MTLLQIHAALANSVLIFSVILGLYGLFLYVRKQGVSSSYWGALAIGEILYLTQGVVGVILYFAGDSPGRWVHILYGILSIITLPALFAFTRGREDRQVTLSYGLIGLFLGGVAIRAITTAR